MAKKINIILIFIGKYFVNIKTSVTFAVQKSKQQLDYGYLQPIIDNARSSQNKKRL